MNGKELYHLLRQQENRYSTSDLGCGMIRYKEVIDGYWRTRYLLNTNTQMAYEIVGYDLFLKSFKPDDVDMSSVRKFEYVGNACRMAAHYPFDICVFRNGVAYVSWTLHPDGMYFMDEDGSGMESYEEESIGAYIDTNSNPNSNSNSNSNCMVLIKFQDMKDIHTRERLY